MRVQGPKGFDLGERFEQDESSVTDRGKLTEEKDATFLIPSS